MLKRIYYASASVLMLALAYHLGSMNVSAQPARPDEIVARLLTIVDDKGQPRAELGTVLRVAVDPGYPTIAQPMLTFLDEKGVRRASLSLDRLGNAVLGMNASDGNVRAMLEGNEDRAALTLFDSKVRVVWKAPR